MPILSRDVAAGVSVSAVVRSGHAVAAVVLLVCVAGVSGMLSRYHDAADLPLPLIALAIMLAALALALFRTSGVTLASYLVVGALANYVFVYSLLAGHPELVPSGIILVNRPEMALVLIGTAGRRPLAAVPWAFGGYLAGAVGTLLAELQAGVAFQLGNAPSVTLLNYCAVFIGLAIIQRTQRESAPNFLKLRDETRRIEAVRGTEQRAVALVHDTVLNDLALVVNGPDVLDLRTIKRMRADVAMLATTSLYASDTTQALLAPSDGSLRNQMTQLVSDFQWRGLTVEFTGDTGSVARMTSAAIEAAVGALRACLENVLAHSGVDLAEIVVSTTADFVTWTVSDAGRGFDPRVVAPDRLGLRTSVFHRVESEGGSVKVWSSPGNGTSVLFSLPQLCDDPDRMATDG